MSKQFDDAVVDEIISVLEKYGFKSDDATRHILIMLLVISLYRAKSITLQLSNEQLAELMIRELFLDAIKEEEHGLQKVIQIVGMIGHTSKHHTVNPVLT